MWPEFMLTYNISTGVLLCAGKRVNRYEHKTCSGDSIIFHLTPEGLNWQVPFFLLDNIFYYQMGNILYIGRHLTDFKPLATIDKSANELLRQQGYIPHARTQLTDVGIVCSYLHYVCSNGGLSVYPCFPYTMPAGPCSTDDLMVAFRKAFRQQIEKINLDRFVLPLSGGMDSRMLLSLALELKDIDLRLFTVGNTRSGDVKVARQIAARVNMESRHIVVDLDDIDKAALLENYKACDYLLPLDRILTRPMGEFFQKSTVISGLYGDVIFDDNNNVVTSYQDYVANEGIIASNELDYNIIRAYDNLPRLPKLYRTLLRGQKLTRQSFPISPGFFFVTPFVAPEVITIASFIKSPRIYQEIVARFMRSELKNIIHQTTLSYFTHPNWIRIAERKCFKLLRHPVRLPYFDDYYLSKIGVSRNEAPPIN